MDLDDNDLEGTYEAGIEDGGVEIWRRDRQENGVGFPDEDYKRFKEAAELMGMNISYIKKGKAVRMIPVDQLK